MSIKFLRTRDIVGAEKLFHSRMTLHRQIRDHKFPPGRLVSPNCRIWTEPEVYEWVASRPVAPKRVGSRTVEPAQRADFFSTKRDEEAIASNVVPPTHDQARADHVGGKTRNPLRSQRRQDPRSGDEKDPPEKGSDHAAIKPRK